MGGSVSSSETLLHFTSLSLYSLLLPFPSLAIMLCIKDSYGTYSVFRRHYAPPAACFFLLVHSALYLLPSSISHSPHISEFPLIRILRVNPPNSPFRGGLAFSPLAKRTIVWERQNKRPPCWWFAVLNPGACFLSFSLPFLSSGEDRKLLILGLPYLIRSLLSISHVFSLPWALFSHYSKWHSCTYDPLTTFGFVFINKPLSLADLVLQSKLNRTTNNCIFC